MCHVRPLLEYNSVTWNRSLKRDIQHIEQVQCRFTERLRGFCDHSYAQRLQLLNLDSLEVQRLKFDLIMCFKIIIYGIVHVKRDEFLNLHYLEPEDTHFNFISILPVVHLGHHFYRTKRLC